eukprot:bmy_06787T0
MTPLLKLFSHPWGFSFEVRKPQSGSRTVHNASGFHREPVKQAEAQKGPSSPGVHNWALSSAAYTAVFIDALSRAGMGNCREGGARSCGGSISRAVGDGREEGEGIGKASSLPCTTHHSECLLAWGGGAGKRKWRGDSRRACFALTQGDSISSRTPHCSPPERVCFEIDSCQMHAASSFSENGDFKSFAAYAVGVRARPRNAASSRRTQIPAGLFAAPSQLQSTERAAAGLPEVGDESAICGARATSWELLRDERLRTHFPLQRGAQAPRPAWARLRQARALSLVLKVAAARAPSPGLASQRRLVGAAGQTSPRPGSGREGLLVVPKCHPGAARRGPLPRPPSPRPGALRGAAGTESSSLKGNAEAAAGRRRSRRRREQTWPPDHPSRSGRNRHSGALTEPRGEGRGARPPRVWDLVGVGGGKRAAGGRRGSWGESDSFAFSRGRGPETGTVFPAPSAHTHTHTHTRAHGRQKQAGWSWESLAPGAERRRRRRRRRRRAARGSRRAAGSPRPASRLLTSVFSAAFSAIFLLRSRQREECFMPIRASKGLPNPVPLLEHQPVPSTTVESFLQSPLYFPPFSSASDSFTQFRVPVAPATPSPPLSTRAAGQAGGREPRRLRGGGGGGGGSSPAARKVRPAEAADNSSQLLPISGRSNTLPARPSRGLSR